MRGPSRLTAVAPASGLIAAAAVAAAAVAVTAFAAAAFAMAALAAPGHRHAHGYDFFYTTTSRSGADVWRASFATVGATARLTAPVPLAAVPNARGIVRLPGGRLLIGAPGRRLYAVNARTGAVRRLRSMPTDRVFLQQSGEFAALPGRTANASPSTGVLDRYTGDLISGRGGIVAAANPRTGATISALNLARATGHRAFCDQTSTDGRGELILACRQMVLLIRLSSTRRLDGPGTSVSVGRLPTPVREISPSFVSNHHTTARRCRRHCTHPVFTG